MHYDKQFAKICAWCKANGVTWHTVGKVQIIKDKKTGRVLKRL